MEARPRGYQFMNNLRRHLNGDLSGIFNGDMVYPRQLEVNLPANREIRCNCACWHCAGRKLDHSLGAHELPTLEILRALEGRVPLHVYAGLYTESTLNPFFMRCVEVTKISGSAYGIHTNGILFPRLEKEIQLVSRIVDLSDDPDDYFSFSLDAGRAESYGKGKKVGADVFTDVIKGIELTVAARGDNAYPKIRICYLFNPFNSSPEEINGTVRLARQLGVDSLKFSVPLDAYGIPFDSVRRYRSRFEEPMHKRVYPLLQNIVSQDESDKPFVFYIKPYYQDPDRLTFNECIYGYYQITIGSDGFVYRCSTTASATFKQMRLGPMTADFSEFERMILSNQDPNFNAQACFSAKARCCRMALEVNSAWEETKPTSVALA